MIPNHRPLPIEESYVRKAIREQRRMRAEMIRREHAEAMAKPFIGHDVLTEEERKAERDRVRNSAQLNWAVRGISL